MADVAINADAANIPAVNFAVQGSDPTAPGSGHCLLYIKSGGVYVRFNGGSATAVGGTPALTTGRLGIGDGSGLLSAMALGTEGQLVTANASGLAEWADAPEGGGGGNAGHILIPCYAWSAYTGSVPTVTVSAQQPFCFYSTRASYATNDSVTYKVDIPAGTYSLALMYLKGNSGGIVDVTLGGSAVVTLDTYTALNTYNQVSTTTGLTVATGGIKDIVLQTNGKHASSLNYIIGVSAISLWRTA